MSTSFTCILGVNIFIPELSNTIIIGGGPGPPAPCVATALDIHLSFIYIVSSIGMFYSFFYMVSI